MPPRKSTTSEVQPRQRRRAATTPEAREQQLIALAVDRVEERMRSGTASSQEYVHFLKLASTREQLEQEKLRRDNELRAAQIEQMASAARMEELYSKALEAMSQYQGRSPEPFYED